MSNSKDGCRVGPERGPAQRKCLLVAAVIVGSSVLAHSRAFPQDLPKPPSDSAPVSTASASPAVLAGHSAHGELFNEGPRQRAVLMGRGISTPFAVSTADPLARTYFEQGICQLHGFWYYEAERSFRQVAALDPGCAMAYWGMAMANYENEKRGAGFAREAWLRRESASPYERGHIEAIARYFEVQYPSFEEAEKVRLEAEQAAAVVAAVAADGGSEQKAPLDGEAARRDYEAKQLADRKLSDVKERAKRRVSDLEKLVYDFPGDIEAKAFLVNQLWLNTHKGIEITSRAANQALLDQVFAANAQHPAHHYAIHLWDTKETADRALQSAAAIGPSVPGIAHMWHMGGHIFDELGRHADAAYQQDASARVDHAYMMRERVMPDQIHNYAHNNGWLVESLAYIGRVHEAIDLARNMIELPRHPAYNALGGRGSAELGRRRLLEVLEMYGLWDELLCAAASPYLDATKDRGKEAQRRALVGVALCQVGRAEEARAEVAAVTALLDEQKRERALAADQAEETALSEKKDAAAVTESMHRALELHKAPLVSIRAELDILEQRLAVADAADSTSALAALAELEKTEFDRGALVELHLTYGDHAKAEELAKKAREDQPKRAAPLARLVHVYETAGKPQDAERTFVELRELSARFDLDLPLFARLAPVAERCGQSQEWRKPEHLPADSGVRVDLATLGPFRWSPSPAPGFALLDEQLQTRTLEEWRGRPVIVIFFLGFGCEHCVEQLNKFVAHAAKFAEAGIELVAIGDDNASGGAKVEAALPGAQASTAEPSPDLPTRTFPILADSSLMTFETWRCYDDFERVPLHGTFLVDAEGDVRWQDIAHQPFMDLDFLWEESKRLLTLPKVSRGAEWTAQSQQPEVPAGEKAGS